MQFNDEVLFKKLLKMEKQKVLEASIGHCEKDPNKKKDPTTIIIIVDKKENDMQSIQAPLKGDGEYGPFKKLRRRCARHL